jgi:translation elongation factor EF-Tu-like GTPase
VFKEISHKTLGHQEFKFLKHPALPTGIKTRGTIKVNREIVIIGIKTKGQVLGLGFRIKIMTSFPDGPRPQIP